MQRPQNSDFPVQGSNDVAQVAYNLNDYPSSDSFPLNPQYGMSSRRQSIARPSNSAQKPYERESYSLVSGLGTNVAASDTNLNTQLNSFTATSSYRPRPDVPGSWSFRRSTLVNSDPPGIARTLSGAEEGRTDPKATAVFSSLSRLSRSISNPKRPGLPVELLYPSDPDTPNLFSPMTNVVHSKSRGSFSSRAIQDDRENARLRPGFKQQTSYSDKDPIKEEPVITKYIRCVSRHELYGMILTGLSIQA